MPLSAARRFATVALLLQHLLFNTAAPVRSVPILFPSLKEPNIDWDVKLSD
jgi:hypothetical protein